MARVDTRELCGAPLKVFIGICSLAFSRPSPVLFGRLFFERCPGLKIPSMIRASTVSVGLTSWRVDKAPLDTRDFNSSPEFSKKKKNKSHVRKVGKSGAELN